MSALCGTIFLTYSDVQTNKLNQMNSLSQRRAFRCTCELTLRDRRKHFNLLQRSPVSKSNVALVSRKCGVDSLKWKTLLCFSLSHFLCHHWTHEYLTCILSFFVLHSNRSVIYEGFIPWIVTKWSMRGKLQLLMREKTTAD